MALTHAMPSCPSTVCGPHLHGMAWHLGWPRVGVCGCSGHDKCRGDLTSRSQFFFPERHCVLAIPFSSQQACALTHSLLPSLFSSFSWAKPAGSLTPPQACPCRPPCLCNWTRSDFVATSKDSFDVDTLIFCEVDANTTQWLKESEWVRIHCAFPKHPHGHLLLFPQAHAHGYLLRFPQAPTRPSTPLSPSTHTRLSTSFAFRQVSDTFCFKRVSFRLLQLQAPQRAGSTSPFLLLRFYITSTCRQMLTCFRSAAMLTSNNMLPC
jgi:hypothetical protein